MTSFMRMSQKLVFHQSKCICSIKRILSTTAMYVSSSSFMYLSTPCYCDACLNSSALRVGVKTLLSTLQCDTTMRRYKWQKTKHSLVLKTIFLGKQMLGTVPYHPTPGPSKFLSGLPNGNYKKKLCCAASRGRMSFKTKYPNCRYNFGTNRPVARF